MFNQPNPEPSVSQPAEPGLQPQATVTPEPVAPTPAESSVTPAGAAPEAAPAPVFDPAELVAAQQRFEQLQGTLDQRVRGFQEALNRQNTQFDEERRQNQARIYQLETAGMDGAELAQYNVRVMQRELQAARQREAQLTQAVQNFRAVGEWVQYWEGRGIPRDRLDSSSVEAVMESAGEYVKSVLAGGAAPASQASTPGQARPTTARIVPQVASSIPGSPPARPKWRDVATKDGAPDWARQEEMIRRVEQGRAPFDSLPEF